MDEDEEESVSIQEQRYDRIALSWFIINNNWFSVLKEKMSNQNSIDWKNCRKRFFYVVFIDLFTGLSMFVGVSVKQRKYPVDV